MTKTRDYRKELARKEQDLRDIERRYKNLTEDYDELMAKHEALKNKLDQIELETKKATVSAMKVSSTLIVYEKYINELKYERLGKCSNPGTFIQVHQRHELTESEERPRPIEKTTRKRESPERKGRSLRTSNRYRTELTVIPNLPTVSEIPEKRNSPKKEELITPKQLQTALEQTVLTMDSHEDKKGTYEHEHYFVLDEYYNEKLWYSSDEDIRAATKRSRKSITFADQKKMEALTVNVDVSARTRSVEENSDRLEMVKTYDPAEPISSSEWETEEETDIEPKEPLKSIVKKPIREESPKPGCSRYFEQQPPSGAKQESANVDDIIKANFERYQQERGRHPGTQAHPPGINSSVPENLRTIYVPTGYKVRGIAQAELNAPYSWTYWVHEWLMFGDAVLYCAARGSIAGRYTFEDDLTRSFWLAGRFLTRIMKRNLRKLPRLPEKMVISIGDQETANDRTRMAIVRQNTKELFEDLHAKGVRYITVCMPMLFSDCLKRRRNFEDYLLTLLDEFQWNWYYFDDHREILFRARNTIEAPPVRFPSHEDTEQITEMLVDFLRNPKREEEKPQTLNQRRAPYEDHFARSEVNERDRHRQADQVFYEYDE